MPVRGAPAVQFELQVTDVALVTGFRVLLESVMSPPGVAPLFVLHASPW